MKRFLDLVERTGDKVIVTDPAGEHPYVLMSLDQYERLLGGASKAPEAPPAPEVKPVLEAKPAPKPVMSAPADKPAASPAPAPVKRSAALWRAQLGREAAAEGAFRPIRDVVKATPARIKTPALAEEAGLDPEGEEKFFLEPLE